MNHYFAYLVGFLAMCCYACLAPMAKKITTTGLEGFQLIFLNSAFLLIFSAVALSIAGENFGFLKKIQISTFGWISVWALTNFIGFALFIWAIGRIPIVDYQIMYLMSPLVGALLAYVLLAEPLQLKHLIGGIIVAAGIYITIK